MKNCTNCGSSNITQEQKMCRTSAPKDYIRKRGQLVSFGAMFNFHTKEKI